MSDLEKGVQKIALSHGLAVALLERMRGRRIAEAELGYGSFITIDFTTDGSEARAPSLWIYGAAWRIESRDEVIASSEDAREQLAGLVPRLFGKTLRDVDVERPSLATVFRFDDLYLKTFPIYSDDGEHWMLFQPNRDVLAAGPGSTWELEVHDGGILGKAINT